MVQYTFNSINLTVVSTFVEVIVSESDSVIKLFERFVEYYCVSQKARYVSSDFNENVYF